MNEPIPFFRFEPTDDEIIAVTDVMRSGWLTSGPQTKAFEEEFLDFIGAVDRQAIAVNSCTAGLHLVMEALGICDNDEVILPTLTFTATAETVVYSRAKPVLVDIDPITLNLDLAKVEAAITPRTKAIVVVHFAGLPADIKAFSDLAEKYSLHLIEDAAHAVTTHYEGKHVGNHNTTATIFSFYANKTITTGEGGIIVTQDEELAKRCRIMATHGIDRDVFARFTTNARKWEYDVIAGGFKYNLPDLAAALGRKQLERAYSLRNQRSAIVSAYRDALKDVPVILPVSGEPDHHHSFHLFPIQIRDDASITRDQLMDKLDEAKIGYSVHYKPLHAMKYWKDLCNVDPSNFPNANDYFSRCISLPLFPSMSNAQLNTVIRSVIEAF